MTTDDDTGTRGSIADTLSCPQIERTPPSVPYAVGLAMVTAGMLLLPTIYAALIGFLAYATYWYLTSDT